MAGEAGLISRGETHSGCRYESERNGAAFRRQPAAVGQMGAVRRIAGTQPHAAASWNGGIVPGLFASPVGTRLPPWTHSAGRNTATGVPRRTFPIGQAAFPVAPTVCRE